MKGNAKYTLDAFKALSLLEDMDFDLTDKNSFQKLDTFINDDGDIPETEIIDLEAENEEDLKDSYLGDIILSCPVCHTNMFKPIDDIVIDEETELCCVGEECPVCGNADGFKILGKVAPFEEEEVEEAEIEMKTEPGEAEVEVEKKEVEDIKEAIRRRMRRKKLKESVRTTKRVLKEDVDETTTFAQWFDASQGDAGENNEFYPFDNYVQIFTNAEVLRDATADDIVKHAHEFYKVYPVDSEDREKAFTFASEVTGRDYEDFYQAWLKKKPLVEQLQEEKKQLIERQWKYQLKNGRKLRDAIEENEEPPFNDVLDALRDCIEELREHVTVENGFDEDDFEWNFEDLLEDIDIWYDDESEEAEDEVNYILEKFYDSCDALNIWVSIVENLEEALPKDLAKAYKSANYNEYADVMAGERAGETRNAGWVDFSGEYHAPDVANMSPKEVGPYIDYQKADYQLLTAEQAKKLPKNQWKNLRMLDRRGDLVVLTPSGSVNTRVYDGWELARKSAPEVFDSVDKIYLTNEKSGEAFLSPDQISKRLLRTRHFYDPMKGGSGYSRELDYYPNSPERLSGRHGAYDAKGSRLSWSARNLDRYKTEAEDTQKLLNDLEQEYAAGDLSPNEYQKRKERLENTLARLKADIEAGERDLTQSRSELQGEKARARYANVEVAMSELQDKLVDLVNTRRNAESNLEQARRELQDVETGQAGEIHTDDTRWWKTVDNVNTKRVELEKAYKELEQLKAKIAQLESETSDDAYATQLQAMRDRVESEQDRVASAQAEVDKLLKRAPKNESLTEAKNIDASKFDKVRDAFGVDNWKRSSDGNYIIFYNDNGIVVGYIPKAKFGSPFRILFDYVNAQPDSLAFENKLTRKFGKDIPNPHYRKTYESLTEGFDNWTDAYKLFTACADRFFPDEEKIRKAAQQVHEIFKGDPQVEEAWKRWNDTDSVKEYEEVDESLNEAKTDRILNMCAVSTDVVEDLVKDCRKSGCKIDSVYVDPYTAFFFIWGEPAGNWELNDEDETLLEEYGLDVDKMYLPNGDINKEYIIDECRLESWGGGYYSYDGEWHDVSINESLTEAVGEKTFEEWFNETQEYWGNKDPNLSTFENYMRDFPNVETLRDATVKDIIKHAHEFYDVYPVDSEDRENAFNFVYDETGRDYDDLYYAWLREKPITESLDEAKNIEGIKGSIAAVAQAHKDELNAAMDMAFNKQSLIDSFMKIMNAHKDELNDEGKKRLDLAKEQMNKMRTLSAVASFITTLITGQKLNDSLKESLDEHIMIYQFPHLDEEDLREARRNYGLQDVTDEWATLDDRGSDTWMKGPFYNIHDFARDYLAYVLVDGYLFDEFGNKVDLTSDGDLLDWDDEEDDFDEEEAFLEAKKKKEVCPDCGKEICECNKEKALDEDIEKATIETENEVINLSSEEKEEDMNADWLEHEGGDLLPDTQDEEMVAPLSDDDVAEIEANSEEETEEEAEEETFPEDEEEFEFDEVQEESFNRLGEQYLKKVYSNVDTFKLDGVSADSSKLVLEGVITFKSGKTKKTSFVFEKVENKNSIAKSKARYVGLNETFTDKKNAYVLNVKKNGKTLVAESLRYNYPAKTKNLNEEVKVVKGLVK